MTQNSPNIPKRSTSLLRTAAELSSPSWRLPTCSKLLRVRARSTATAQTAQFQIMPFLPASQQTPSSHLAKCSLALRDMFDGSVTLVIVDFYTLAQRILDSSQPKGLPCCPRAIDCRLRPEGSRRGLRGGSNPKSRLTCTGRANWI